MHQCSKRLVTYKEYCCFDHSDFPAHSMFTFDVCWGSLGTISSGTQVVLQVILDPDHLPDYLSVSYDYVYTHYSCVVIIFFYRGLSKSAFSYYYFGEIAFSLSVFFLPCVMSFEFDSITTWWLEHSYIIIVYVSTIWPSVILLSLEKKLVICKNHKIKIWFWHILVKKNMLPKRFWVKWKSFKKKMRNSYKT